MLLQTSESDSFCRLHHIILVALLFDMLWRNREQVANDIRLISDTNQQCKPEDVSSPARHGILDNPSLFHPVPESSCTMFPTQDNPSLSFCIFIINNLFYFPRRARTHNLCIMNHYRYHYTSGSVASQPVNVL